MTDDHLSVLFLCPTETAVKNADVLYDAYWTVLRSQASTGYLGDCAGWQQQIKIGDRIKLSDAFT